VGVTINMTSQRRLTSSKQGTSGTTWGRVFTTLSSVAVSSVAVSSVALSSVAGTLALGSSGCDKVKTELIERTEKVVKQAEAVATQVQAEPAKDPEAERDAHIAGKLGNYIDCLNSLSRSAFSSRERYLSWAPKNGVTGKERLVYGLYQLSDPKPCFKSIADAKLKSPALPEIEQAAARYEAAFSALNAQVQKAYPYYDQNDYKDDAFANAKALHGPLLQAFDDFEQAHGALDKLIEALNDEVGARELTRVSKDPARQLEYRGRKLVAEAKKIVHASHVNTLQELDGTAYTLKIESLSAAISELETYLAAHAEEADRAQGEDRVLAHAKDLQKAAKELARRKRENKDFNKEFMSRNAPQMVEGHPAQVIEKFNNFIRTSNSARY
jgi:hypothetical protein